MRIGGDSSKIFSGQVDNLLKQNPETRISKFFNKYNTPIYSDKLSLKDPASGTLIPKQPPAMGKRLDIVITVEEPNGPFRRFLQTFNPKK